MRKNTSIPIFSVALILLVTSTSHGEDQSSPLAALFGKKENSSSNVSGRSNRDSAEKTRSQGGGGGLFGLSGNSGSSLLGGPKRVEIDLSDQKLRAYQGNRLVFKTRISSGRNGATPTGRFNAGPYKAVDHYSSLYHNAHMPWSVQVSGHIFVHGYISVPNYPASHGCIRVPISGSNPARRFYKWVDVGTPITIKH